MSVGRWRRCTSDTMTHYVPFQYYHAKCADNWAYQEACNATTKRYNSRYYTTAFVIIWEWNIKLFLWWRFFFLTNLWNSLFEIILFKCRSTESFSLEKKHQFNNFSQQLRIMFQTHLGVVIANTSTFPLCRTLRFVSLSDRTSVSSFSPEIIKFTCKIKLDVYSNV